MPSNKVVSLEHLPSNYRVVCNGNGRWRVQKRCIFWFDWAYDTSGYSNYCPSFTTKEEACLKALSTLRKKADWSAHWKRERTIVSKHRC